MKFIFNRFYQSAPLYGAMLITSFLSSNAIFAQDNLSPCYFGGQLVYEVKSLNDQHEQFYCEMKPAHGNTEHSRLLNSRVLFYNFGAMVTGFDSRGLFKSNAAELNQFYFDAFHDTERKFAGIKGYVCAILPKGSEINCRSGKGGRNDRITGPYG